MTDIAPEKLARPEQLKTLTNDQLVAVILRLTMEISVLRDRLATHECLMEEKGLLASADIDSYSPDADEARARAASRTKLIEGVMRDLQD